MRKRKIENTTKKGTILKTQNYGVLMRSLARDMLETDVKGGADEIYI